MLALIYLGLAIALGDVLCRRYYRFLSLQHRYAAAILAGILFSTWGTYLAALAFSHTTEPLLWADLLFLVTSSVAIFWFSKRSCKLRTIEPRAPGQSVSDWITLGVLFLVVCVLLMGTLYVNKQGRIRVSGIEASDFALQAAIAQGFALGHNLPPQSPYYAGQTLHYDFLFYFQAGNLELLGLNLAWAVTLLSVLGLISLLALVMALGELLFNSRVVGRTGATLFFFSGSLAFIPFWNSHHSIDGALPVVTQFVRERHLAGAIGALALILVFLVDQYHQRSAHSEKSVDATANHSDTDAHNLPPKLNASFIFSGVLLGALPLWSASVFVCTAVVLLLLLILFRPHPQMLALGIVAAVIAFFQLSFLNSGAFDAGQQRLFHWPLPDNRTISTVIGYIGFAGGAKWPVLILSIFLISRFQRRFFLAWCGLLILPFCIRLGGTSMDHTFLNIWLVLANLFAAYGLWWLWNLTGVPGLGPLTATALTACIVVGGIIDLTPVRNSSYVDMSYERDDLVKWLSNNTKPNDVFLTDRFLTHSVLLAGRKIFLGPHDLLAGYDSAGRESIYQQMFESKNPRHVFELLKQNHIDYVAVDDGVRHGSTVRDVNEYVYSRYFQRMYDDKENRYQKLVIYKVPELAPPSVKSMDLSEPAVTAFRGGKGTGKGQFDNPRGLAVDNTGNIFVADTGNARIQKFSPNGTYITSLGTQAGYGQLGEPNGLAIDRSGNIYVADVSTHSVRKLTADGKPVAQWAPALYGPRRIAIGPDNSIYVVDQGHSRIVKLNVNGDVLTTWGSGGSGDGQFKDPTSVAVDPTSDKVYVADPINHRIQIFDSAGNFQGKWSVAGWGEPHGFEDLAIDAQRGRLYASSGNINSILIFDLKGNGLGTLTPMPPDKLSSPSALALAKDKLYVLNSASARLSGIVLQNKLQTSPAIDR